MLFTNQFLLWEAKLQEDFDKKLAKKPIGEGFLVLMKTWPLDFS
jgi:hypothetical protein